MTTQENKALVRRFVREVWNEQHRDRIDELYSPDYVGHWYQLGGADVDREGLKAFVREVHRGFPDFRMDVEFIHGEDDLVTVGFTSSGTHEGEFMGISPGGTETGGGATPGHLTSRIEDGEIVEGWATWDALGLLQGLGVIPGDLAKVAPAADDD